MDLAQIIMIPDIFSSFDQNIFYIRNKIWILILLIHLYLNSNWWITPFPSIWIKFKIDSFILNQLSLTRSKHLKRFIFIISSIFCIIIILNISGLIPYIFRISRHLIFALNLRIPLWLSLLLSSFISDWKISTANFLPSGAPTWLNPFLILIETSRILVRPITLGFRLAANISAGHIILILIRSYLAARIFSSPSTFIFLFFIQIGYFLFEIAISLIQAYIFCLLISLYRNDHAIWTNL